MSLHISYCQEFGLSKEDMEQTEESEGQDSCVNSNPGQST